MLDSDSAFDYRATGEFGDAEVTIDVTPDVAARAHEAYTAAVGAGYTEDFVTFLFNQTHTEMHVECDGEPFEPGPWLDWGDDD